MGIFSFLQKRHGPIGQLADSQEIGSANISEKVSKLIARLEEPPKNPTSDNCFGYFEVDKIVTELESIGDSSALPSLIAKQKAISEHLDMMTRWSQHLDDQLKHNYQFLSGLQEKTRRVIGALEGKANESVVENTPVQQTRSSDTSSANSREVVFVIPCGVCGYKTEVAVTIDWGGRILSGTSTDHVFHCMNCKKVFTVSKESLKQHTDRFV